MKVLLGLLTRCIKDEAWALQLCPVEQRAAHTLVEGSRALSVWIIQSFLFSQCTFPDTLVHAVVVLK